MKIKFMDLLVLVILGGCSATGDDYIRGQVPTVINHPVFGDLTVSERVLLGPDVNQNGIRDDIDIVINKLSDERKSDISLYVQDVTRGMLFGSRGISNAASEKLSATVVSPPITDAEKNSYIGLVANTVPRKAAFAIWASI